ncbi:hypothetical protein HMPREF0083_00455 [Aneurinibacillus aneurinilyticus ATCC 12856]|uniref:Uncharacterized protein n=1 Tax=Aneurinibacillus aneurinilyticus ATCC 12856 TaxID=649747 RepID=U1XA88_ANEAE|nr:hypothetical protein HMPREF0083_00455 [Aneurinibacillus aneurinilyticus ATCC 12856]
MGAARTYNSHVIRDYIFNTTIRDNMRIFYFIRLRKRILE